MIRILKEQKGALIRRHAQADNVKASMQVLTTLVFLSLLWWAALLSVHVSCWLTAAAVLPISLFTVRAFALMHECGHGSLFRTQRLNRAFGFLLGVIRDATVRVVSASQFSPRQQRQLGKIPRALHDAVSR